MEDQVPFKVFTFWSDDSKPEVRRFGVDKTAVTNFHYLNAKLQDVYPGLKGKQYSVTWKDEDGDDITISSDEELLTALTALDGNLIRFNIYVAGASGEDKEDIDIFIAPVMENNTVPGEKIASMTHFCVTCDGCNSQVVGFRYKCTSCYDFDLCSKCEAAGMHPEHVMVRLPSPAVPRDIVKAAIKRSRHILKTVASAAASADAHKRHRRDKSAERRDHSRQERHHRADYHGRRPRSGWLDTFASYMNEFANLAGEADAPPQPRNEPKKPEEPKTSSEGARAPPQPEPARPSPDPNAFPFAHMQIPFIPGMDVNKFAEMYFNNNLGAFMRNAAPNCNPNGVPDSYSTSTYTFSTAPTGAAAAPAAGASAPSAGALAPSAGASAPSAGAQAPGAASAAAAASAGTAPAPAGAYTPASAADVSAPGPAAPAPCAAVPAPPAATPAPPKAASAAGTGDDVEMGDGAQKAQNAIKTETSAPANDENVRELSPDKIDGWTMINPMRDLLDSKAAASDEAGRPVGFNLPEEFQERMRINEGQNIYPPLNVATAEPERPRVPIVPQPAQAPSQEPKAPKTPQAPFAPQGPFGPQAPFVPQMPFAPQGLFGSHPFFTSQGPNASGTPLRPAPAEPRVRHRLAHIEAAIQQMLAMGFNNEGGWLTKLLESKDGNIAAVVDLLTPPKV